MATVERLFLGGRLYRSRPGTRNLARELFARLVGTPLEPATDADSLFVRDGRIVAIGAARNLVRQAPAAEHVELGGAVVLPGLVDTHCHLVAYGLARIRGADLLGARSIAEVQERLRRHLAATGIRPGDGRWLLGRGFDQEGFAERRWIARADLDAVSAEVPICIRRVCGHALVANSAAIARADISAPVEAPGGPDSLERGIFTEERMTAIDRAIPPPSDVDYRQAATLATAEAAAVGFTGVHCLVTEPEEVAALRHLEQAGQLPVRIRLQLAYGMLPSLRALGLATGFGSDRLTLGAIKIFSDGSLGARTAALFEPYADDPGNRGDLLFPQEELDTRVQAVADAGCQVCVHAIGDRALHAVLTAFERCRDPRPRPRVEHASIAPPPLIDRMRRIGAVAAVQPQFVVSDWWTKQRLGAERARWAYPFRTMLATGVPLAGGTDCPVERLLALQVIARAVHRGGMTPEETLTVDEAIALLTIGAAYAAGEERVAGALAPGYRADFVALADDPRDVPPDAIETIPIQMTVVAGEIVHRA